ncbi:MULTISPECIES: hypothetical protein [Legionella]|uniref:Glycosyl transferase family 2 n=1 Tax=Legionella drozanskii LLAP-1 TaxID=1212489 RepID=A0A0W0TC80_9GAMM|nr:MULTISPECIES: hypothetical protein [Legionella]KTC93179.1 hypothetical protein Ldro_0550 [Legionella drozanskii LLAP-1]PJE14171.1 MAG: hypothetical protein CK430_05465 [Legionella sp.]
MITVKIASIPERMLHLESTICQFLSYVNKIEIYLNNYSEIPTFLNNSRIEVFTSQKSGDIGDIGKFHQIEEALGYVLTIDDDLIYPSDYVEKMIEKIDFYNKKAFICVHANLLPQEKLSSYYKDKQGLYFERKLSKDTIVDVPGTGTLGFHTDHIKLSQSIFGLPNMTDIWLAIYAKEKNIPIVAMERKDKWVLQARGDRFVNSIYQSSVKNDSYQTHLINNAFRLATII